MNKSDLRLSTPPIVEAIVDIECDLPPGYQFDSIESRAREVFGASYKKFRTQLIQEFKIESKPGEEPKQTIRHGIQAFQFIQEDDKQLVQIRLQGYSFNRLAPYTTLDDYLPEIERTWRLYIELATPVQVKLIRLRYINRILIPLIDGKVDLDKYFKVGPQLPDEEKLTLVGFLNQHSAVEVETGHQVNIILTAQPQEGDKLPVIFDNTVIALGPHEPDDWSWINSKIMKLRTLKNLIFRNTLTEPCLNLFQQP